MTIDQIYTNQIRPLSAADRLRLARLILNDIAPDAVIDVSDVWSEADLHDLSAASLGAEEGFSESSSCRPGTDSSGSQSRA